MATNRATIDTILDRMLPLEVTAKAMFGEYSLYLHGINFALVCDNTLFVKVTDPGSALAARITRAAPYPGARPAFKISSAKLAQREWLVQLVEVTQRALPATKPRAKKTSSAPRPSKR